MGLLNKLVKMIKCIITPNLIWRKRVHHIIHSGKSFFTNNACFHLLDTCRDNTNGTKTCQMSSDGTIFPLWDVVELAKYTGRAGNMDIWTWNVRELFKIIIALWVISKCSCLTL